MKFMKLGSKPDTFHSRGSDRLVASEVSSDLVIHVNGRRYLLHKFPLLSKSLHLQRLYSESYRTSHPQTIRISDFPGGVHAFELCAKFCYNITITISPRNLVLIRCASEFLQMTDLVQKIESFFNSCILHKWKDMIVTLRSTRSFPLYSEDLKITSRCVEAITSMVSSYPLKASLSRSDSRTNWWAEDLAELGIDHYCRTMLAIKSGVKVQSYLIGDALRIYASRWLSNIYVQEDSEHSVQTSKHKLVLESIVRLLPPEKSAVSCSFLLKLLKAANIVKASSSTKNELVKRIGLQLDEASVNDLLFPALSSNTIIYDVDIFLTILEQFMLLHQSPTRNKSDFERRRSRSADNADIMFKEDRISSSSSHSSKLKVAKLVDKYLQKIAEDKNLSLSKFIEIAEAVPESARLDHDDLYKAIDAYLKGHPELTKKERKRLCRALDCKKLSEKMCVHAARNDMLPLRLVIQVLFFEQARAGNTGNKQVTGLPRNIKALLSDDKELPKTMKDDTVLIPEDQWSVSGLKSSSKSGVSSSKMRLKVHDDDGASGYLDVNFLDRFERSSVIKSRPISKTAASEH